MENSIDFEVVEPSLDAHDDSNRMYVSTSTIGDTSPEEAVESEYDELLKLSSAERNARLIGRRVDILAHQASIHSAPQWMRGTILNFDKEKDVHWVLIDGEMTRREYKLNEVIFRLVETEEEWVDIGDRTVFNVSASGHEFIF
jgi:hypothetical protein